MDTQRTKEIRSLAVTMGYGTRGQGDVGGFWLAVRHVGERDLTLGIDIDYDTNGNEIITKLAGYSEPVPLSTQEDYERDLAEATEQQITPPHRNFYVTEDDISDYLWMYDAMIERWRAINVLVQPYILDGVDTRWWKE